MSLPSRTIEPLSGVSKPPISVSVVVLPEPLGPSSVMNSPRLTSSEIFLIADTAPYDLSRPRSCRNPARSFTASTSCSGALPLEDVQAAFAIGEIDSLPLVDEDVVRHAVLPAGAQRR